MNSDETNKAEAEKVLVRPTVPAGELTPDDWYAYKARCRHYDFERLRRGLVTREQFDRENSLEQMWGDLRGLMKKAQIESKPTTLPDFLQRMADERERARRGDGEANDEGKS